MGSQIRQERREIQTPSASLFPTSLHIIPTSFVFDRDVLDTVKQYNATGYSTAQEVSSSRQPSQEIITASAYHQHCVDKTKKKLLATQNAPVP
jgi:hypothetical protein